MRRIFAFLSIIFVSTVSILVASEINFPLQLSFTVPGLSGPITQVKFNDINRDGFPEVLATDGQNVVLYSVTADSIIFDFECNTADCVQTMLFQDVNRDSIPDIVVDLRAEGPIFGGRSIIEIYNGALNYGTMDSISFPYYFSPTDGCCSGNDIVFADDYNDDGYNELLVSVENIIGGVINEYTNGMSYLFWSFPDSLIWQKETYFDVASELPLDGSSKGLWLRSSHCTYWEMMGTRSLFIGRHISFLDSAATVIPISLAPPNVCVSDSIDFYQEEPHFWRIF